MRAPQFGFAIFLVLIAVVLASGFLLAQSEEAESLDRQVVELHSAGKSAEAMLLAKRSLALREKALPAGHPDIAHSLENLAFLYRAQGGMTEAEPLLKRALEMREKALPAGHRDIGQTLNDLATLYQAQGRLTEAEALTATSSNGSRIVTTIATMAHLPTDRPG